MVVAYPCRVIKFPWEGSTPTFWLALVHNLIISSVELRLSSMLNPSSLISSVFAMSRSFMFSVLSFCSCKFSICFLPLLSGQQIIFSSKMVTDNTKVITDSNYNCNFISTKLAVIQVQVFHIRHLANMIIDRVPSFSTPQRLCR